MLIRTDKRDSIAIHELQGQAFGGGIQYWVEFPNVFDGEVVFLNCSQDSAVESLYRHDAASIGFLSSILLQTTLIPPRGCPKDVTEETKTKSTQVQTSSFSLPFPAGFRKST